MNIRKEKFCVEEIYVESSNRDEVQSKRIELRGEGFGVTPIMNGYKDGDEDSKVFYFNGTKKEKINSIN